MKINIAFASSDGKVVNQHFGKAKAFHIVEVDDEEKSYKYIESRVNNPCCKEFEHSDDDLQKSISLIKDCSIVFIAKIGRGAYAKLQENNIKAIEAPYFIEDILKELLE